MGVRVSMCEKVTSILLFLIFTSGLPMANGDHPKASGEETDPKTFKILREKLIDPKTGLPRTLEEAGECDHDQSTPER
jgi:hypothetical protein